jgi:hypothetical protein
VVKYVDAVELRVVVAAVLAAAADAVLVAHHLVTALARLHVRNLARRSSLEAESTREKKGGEEEINIRHSEWQFGTGNRKHRRRARVYPELGNQGVLPLQPLEL